MRKRLFSVILAALVGLGTSACGGAGQENGEPFDVLRLVSCEGASVRFAAAGGEDDVALSGILAESDVPYAGAFNSIFTGDLEITFGFQEDEPVSYRRFTFTFASASQPEKSFSVVYEASWTDPAQATGQSGVYVRCGSEVRTTRYWQTADREEAWQSNADLDVGNALASPMFSGFGFGEQYGRLSLSWGSDGVLEVSVTEYSDPDGRSPRVIAAFDGSTATGFDPAAGTWGLPLMDISGGYILSFTAEDMRGNGTDGAPDVYFSSIEAGPRGRTEVCDLSSPVLETAPSFYAATSADNRQSRTDIDKQKTGGK